ncbi:DUF5825 family protein [Streptomyces sp. NPDC001093]|uniref:DUF5825 family protein n=1 Tax=Streptomyces sp. NPDC001093 TaxID=3154376 RepID=UPI0033200545
MYPHQPQPRCEHDLHELLWLQGPGFRQIRDRRWGDTSSWGVPSGPTVSVPGPWGGP